MKYLLFTHSQDIDGIGCYVVGSQCLDLECIFCKTFEITSKFKEKMDIGFDEYEKVFVTDLCIKEPILGIIDSDHKLKGKIIVLDHHKTEIDEGNDKYSFVNITVSKNGIKECGTSLFYKYLVNNNYLVPNNTLDTFVEFTRQYDVWDWHDINNQEARKLHIYFENCGIDSYVCEMNKVLNNKEKFLLTDFVEKICSDFERKLNTERNNIVKDMKVKEIFISDIKYRIGFVKALYRYRNDLDDFIRDNNVNNIDCVCIIMEDLDSVSYRSVKDIDVSNIAVYFGGKGHRKASSNLQNNPLFIEFISDLY